MTHYQTYSSKTLGGLVVECSEDHGTTRAVLKRDGSGAVYYKPASSDKFLVHSYGKKGRARGMKMLDAAKAAFQ